MAKKFGKFLLVAAVATAAAAGTYYYMQKKGIKLPDFDVNDDDDFDDFGEDEDFDEMPRSYVSLNPTVEAVSEDGEEPLFEEAGEGEGDFIPLAEQLAEKKDETVEEFFDEEA